MSLTNINARILNKIFNKSNSVTDKNNYRLLPGEIYPRYVRLIQHLKNRLPWWSLLLLPPNPSQHQGLFQWVNSSREVAKVFKFQPQQAMAHHSSTLAWKIPWMEEPGRLQSMGSLRVGHDWATSLSLFTFMHWRRKWQPTPVFLPGEFQGLGSLVGFRLWGRTESDTTEVT